MAQITGGKVTFGRTVQPAQYESKKAEVEMTFVVSEGEDFTGMLVLASQAAHDKAMELVGLKQTERPSKAIAPASVAPLPTINDQHGPAQPAPTKEAAAAAMNAKEANAAQAAVDKPAKPPKANKKPVEDKPKVGDDDLLDDSKPAEISDQALEGACKAKKDKLGDGGGTKIKALRDRFTGSTVKSIREIVRDKRAEFMKELEELA